RTVTAMGGGTYVVADRTLAKKSGFMNHVRWHFNTLGTPVLNGSTISETVGASNVFVTTVLPATPSINLVNDGTDHCNTGRGCSVNYRAEVSDSAGGPAMNVLTVISATASSSSQPAVTNLSTLGSIDANHQGVQVNGNVP